MKVIAGFLFVLALISVCAAIFQEQLGEYDWKKENFGLIDKSVQFHDKLFVATSEDVVSSINVNTGGINWRALYPKSSSFEQLMVVNDCVVVLSTQKSQEDVSTSLLRGWSIADGTLMWDMSLGAIATSDLSHSDLMFDSKSNLLIVLFRNSLYFVTPPLNSRSNSAVDVWFWTPDVAEGSVWTLSSLLVPTTFVDKEKSGSASSVARVAVGCLQSPAAICEKTGVFKINKNTKTVTVDEFVGLPTAADGLIKGTVSSDDRYGYSSEDLLFAVAQSSLSVVNLQDGSVSDAAISLPEGATLLEVPRAFVFASADGDIKPAVSVCFSTGSTEQQQCSAFVAHSTSGAGITLTALASSACSGRHSLVLAEPSTYSSSLTSTFDCLSVQWNHADSLLESLAFSSTGGLVNKRVDLKVVHPSPSALTSKGASSAFRHVAVTRAVDGGGGSKSSVVVLVLHSGLTVGIAVSSSAGGSKVIWTRDEALTHMRWVELVDVDKKATAVGDSAEMPSVLQRLKMQQEEALDYVKGALESAKHLQSFVQHHINKLLGKNKGEVVAKDVERMKLFGFGKVAVSLCYSNELDNFLNTDSTASSAESVPTVRFSEAGFKIVALNVLQDSDSSDSASIKWTSFPSFSSAADPVVTFVRLLSSSHSSNRATPVRSIYLLVGTAEGDTLLWSFDAFTGKSSIKEHNAKATVASSTSVVPVAATLSGQVTHSVSVRASSGDENSHFKATHSILHEAVDGDHSTLSVTHIGSNKNTNAAAATGSSEFVHYVDKASGTVRIFKLNGNSCAGNSKQPTGPLAAKLSCHQAEAVATAVFPTDVETIVDVTYRNSYDVVNSRSAILGDDSVLLKYLNPNVVLITTISPPAAAATNYAASSGNAGGASGDSEGSDAVAAASSVDSELSLTLVDTVTGKIIKRITLESAVRPVHNVFVENAIVTTYWNNKAKRTELSSVALYEGVIDKYDMGPFASSKTKANPPHYHAATYSAYSTIAPMAMQKTYTLPTAVTALQHTLTANGISNKNILVGLRTGQVLSLDMRMIHPRRPMTEPSQSEKEEGLMKYNPFLVFNYQMSSLTYNYALLGHGVSHIVSAPSRLESSSLVLSFGNSVDIHLNRALPSQGFDMLASDFNYSLLVTILVGLGLVVVVLRRMHQKKHLKAVWA